MKKINKEQIDDLSPEVIKVLDNEYQKLYTGYINSNPDYISDFEQFKEDFYSNKLFKPYRLTVTFKFPDGTIETRTPLYGNSVMDIPKSKIPGFVIDWGDISILDRVTTDLLFEGFIYNEGLLFVLNENETEYSVGRGTMDPWEKKLIIPSTYNKIPVTSIFGDFSVNITDVYISSNINKIPSMFLFSENRDTTNIHIVDLRAFCKIEGYIYIKYGTVYNIYINEMLISDLILPNGVSHLRSIFRNSSIKSVTFSNDITMIDSGTFDYCIYLTNVRFGTGLRATSTGMFRGCVSLKTVTAPDYTIYEIGDYSFQNCSGLTELPFFTNNARQTIYTIGEYAYAQCENIQKITLGGSVQIIKAGAFYGTGTEIGFYMNRLEHLGFAVFQTSKIIDIKLPKHIVEVKGGLLGYMHWLKSFVLPEYIDSIDTRSMFQECPEIEGSIILPNYIKHVGNNCFYGVSGVTDITIPESVISMGTDIFPQWSYSKLKNIIILAITPPELVATSISKTKAQTIFYVPDESIDLYKTAPYWSERASYIKPLSEKPV